MLKLWIQHFVFEKSIDIFFSSARNAFDVPSIGDNERDRIHSILFESYTRGFPLTRVYSHTAIYLNVTVESMSDNIGLVKLKASHVSNRITGEMHANRSQIELGSDIWKIVY